MTRSSPALVVTILPPKSSFDRRNGFQNGYEDGSFEFTDRQSGETFKATRLNSRSICLRGTRRSLRCRLRVSWAIQFRKLTDLRAQRFVQAEQYLIGDDVQIIRFFQD